MASDYHPGWSKLAHSILYTNDEETEITVAIWAPVEATLGPIKIEINTKYPFSDNAIVTVSNRADGSTNGHRSNRDLLVKLRVPSWAPNAIINGEKVKCSGCFHTSYVSSGTSSTFSIDFKPEVTLKKWNNNSISVHRGALLYSLPIPGKFSVYGHHYGTEMSDDYYLTPPENFAWNLALDADSFQFVNASGYVDGREPFYHTNWPNQVSAVGRQVWM